ncbi:MAG: PilZ domain-containing protein [Methyloprofundus sp.]|nr:PilZ domain-containing protein [Methyloprofundus sp.]
MNQKRRLTTRVAVPLLAVSIQSNEYDISGQALDISLGGIAIKCSTFDRDQVTPKGDYVREGKPLEVSLVLNLPENKKSNYALKAKCRVVYSRRLTQDECQLGMYFLEIDAVGKEHLMKFVEKHV